MNKYVQLHNQEVFVSKLRKKISDLLEMPDQNREIVDKLMRKYIFHFLRLIQWREGI